jgi:hypothetical protein
LANLRDVDVHCGYTIYLYCLFVNDNNVNISGYILGIKISHLIVLPKTSINERGEHPLKSRGRLTSEVPGQSCRALPDLSVKTGHKRTSVRTHRDMASPNESILSPGRKWLNNRVDRHRACPPTCHRLDVRKNQSNSNHRSALRVAALAGCACCDHGTGRYQSGQANRGDDHLRSSAGADPTDELILSASAGVAGL